MGESKRIPKWKQELFSIKATEYGYMNFEVIGTSYGSHTIREYLEVDEENNSTFRVTETLKWFAADAKLNSKMTKFRESIKVNGSTYRPHVTLGESIETTHLRLK